MSFAIPHRRQFGEANVCQTWDVVKRRWLGVLAAVVLGAGTFLAVRTANEPVRISSFEAVSESGLVLNLPAICGGEPDVDITESESEIWILVESDNPRGPGQDCGKRRVSVQLEAGFVRRSIMDVSTGLPIPNLGRDLVTSVRTIVSYRAPNERQLLLQAGVSCSADFDVEVLETASEIWITVEATSVSLDDCVTWPRVELDLDLGDRRVFDASRDREVRRLRSGL